MVKSHDSRNKLLYNLLKTVFFKGRYFAKLLVIELLFLTSSCKTENR